MLYLKEIQYLTDRVDVKPPPTFHIEEILPGKLHCDFQGHWQ